MNALDPDRCYRALSARDSRFDGIFFVGVKTTGIYCRPVCRARLPGRDRCTFHPTAAAAERCGYRPCLRCRPELAPGRAIVDAAGRIAATAARRIEAGALNGRSVAELAADLCVGERQLRRALRTSFGVSPIELAQTHRLLTAKQLLTESSLPVSQVAYVSGFSSLRRFNALFRERYRLSPSELRRSRPAEPEEGRPLVLTLAYRPPLDWSALLSFLAVRATPGIESVDGTGYRRTVSIGTHRGLVSVWSGAHEGELRVEVSLPLAPALMPLLARLRGLFDLDAEPATIDAHLASDPALRDLVAARPGLRVPGAFDGFELAVRAILGQQVSVRAATTLAGRMAAALCEPAATEDPRLTRWPLDAARIADADVSALTELGLTRARAASVLALARIMADGELSLDAGADVEDTVARLVELPGIGAWTAQYIAMRALHWPDAFPHGDLVLRRALGDASPAQVLEAAERWRPWRAYAAMHLWNASSSLTARRPRSSGDKERVA